MAESLVIVESPAKAKTIEKFLGSKYKVVASQGHIRDLPKSKLGVDVEHGFEPSYIALRGRKEVLETIRKEAKKADKVYLATDPDREGEAISWHLAEVLKLDEKSKCRIEFNEITSAAVKGSFKKARPINMRGHPDHLRPGGGDQRVRPQGVLDHHRPAPGEEGF